MKSFKFRVFLGQGLEVVVRVFSGQGLEGLVQVFSGQGLDNLTIFGSGRVEPMFENFGSTRVKFEMILKTSGQLNQLFQLQSPHTNDHLLST